VFTVRCFLRHARQRKQRNTSSAMLRLFQMLVAGQDKVLMPSA
jgi:hypothetical protein